ncbi:diacylglycerol kinase (ATP) [Catenulispora sp. GP43]|uniref:diacylglycerol/lipid kinase family protein n=1 Tax=Catenulispora sp. GP43 TaxID=3156263 RepID=UPI0035165176
MNQVALVVHEGKLAALRGDDPRDLLRWALRERGDPPPKVYATTSDDPGGQAVRTALADGARLVVVCGGDGTVSACAAALAGTGIPMAVVPIGTGNLVARNLGVPRDPAEAVAVAVNGVDQAVDVGRLDDGVMVGMAGAGLDAAMVQDAPHRLKRRIGWPAYVVSLVRHLADRGFAATVEVDGHLTRHKHIRTVVIGNVGALHGGISLFPDARPDDGVLEVAILAPRTVLGWASVVVHLMRGQGRSPAVEQLRGRHIVVRAQRPLRREADGEPLADAPVLDVRVAPKALLLRLKEPLGP